MPTINLLKPKKRDKTISKQRLQHIYQDKRWKRVRAAKFRLNPLCEDCLLQGRVTLTQEVHHTVPIEDDPELIYAFDIDYTVSVCTEHHKIRDAELRQKRHSPIG